MHEIKDTNRALVRIGFDGRVHKTFRGREAYVRFANEVRVLRHLEQRGCGFVPRLLEVAEADLKITTTNCGSRVEQLNPERMKELFAELGSFGVRHDDINIRNVTYRRSDGRFCLIDFEFATLIDEAAANPGPPPPDLRWSGQTHRGHVRPNNEDTFLALEFDGREVRYLGKIGEASLAKADFVFAVSDGMGGAKSGEFASRITIDKITGQMPKNYRTAAPGLQSRFDRILHELFRDIHQDLIKLGESYEECRGMGTTLSLCWLTPGWMYFGHIGDSRIYHVPQGGALTQLTHDHGHVGWLRRNLRINEREARSHPMRNVLNQSLGAGHQFIEPQYGAIPCTPGDRFLLCSDGLVEGMWDRHLDEMAREPDVAPLAQHLVAAALERAGRDNITALVVEALPGDLSRDAGRATDPGLAAASNGVPGQTPAGQLSGSEGCATDPGPAAAGNRKAGTVHLAPPAKQP